MKRALRIAMVSTPWFSVPPKAYGGIEWIVSHLTEELTRRGHDVTLFSVGGSKTSARLKTYFKNEQREAMVSMGLRTFTTALTHSLFSYTNIARSNFDLIHDHTWKDGVLTATFFDGPPLLHTLHGPLDEQNRQFYRLVKNPNISFASISDFQRRAAPRLPFVGTVYNAIDVEHFPFRVKKDNYLLFLGRIAKDKGTHLACEAAKRLGAKLIIAGKLAEPAEISYFKTKVKPYLGRSIKYLGEVSDAKKKQLFARARAFVLPLKWHEPFGLVMVEAMATGTPVVTFHMGSASEVVVHGQTGFVVKSFGQLLSAIKKAHTIDPHVCRRHVEANFSVAVMADHYEQAYKKILTAHHGRRSRH